MGMHRRLGKYRTRLHIVIYYNCLFKEINSDFQLELQYQALKNKYNEYTEKLKDIVKLKNIMNEFNIIKIYAIFTQQQDINSIQVPIEYKLGDTGIYLGP